METMGNILRDLGSWLLRYGMTAAAGVGIGYFKLWQPLLSLF